MPVMPPLVSTSTTRKLRASPKAWPLSHGVCGHGTRSMVVRTAVMVMSLMGAVPSLLRRCCGNRRKREGTAPMSDMTITAVRTTMLRVPWPQTPWLKGHAFGEARNFLVVDVETKGGIAGMGYLFLFRPGIRSIIACLDEVIVPRVIGKD